MLLLLFAPQEAPPEPEPVAPRFERLWPEGPPQRKRRKDPDVVQDTNVWYDDEIVALLMVC